MEKELIKISLTEFMDFVNKSGMSKMTVVSSAKTRREDEYKAFTDYWLKLREKIKEVHKKHLSQDDFRELIGEIKPDKVENYHLAIEGYCKFWGKKKIDWVKPPRKIWNIGNVRLAVNPELGLKIKDRTYYVKIYTKANGQIDKRHADMILTLMEQELRPKVEEDDIFAVLDIKRGKLFSTKPTDPKLRVLLKSEAQEFETIWRAI